MRCLLFVTGVFAALFCIETHAKAQNYPWCAQYGASPSAPTNCGFVTFQQCLDTISGIGEFCVRNNLYQPPPGPHPSKKVRTRPQSERHNGSSYGWRSSSGSLAMFTAIRRASSCVSME